MVMLRLVEGDQSEGSRGRAVEISTPSEEQAGEWTVVVETEDKVESTIQNIAIMVHQ